MSHTILLAAGGTGGHIIPSIAFGQWLKGHGETPLWLTGSRPLEKVIFDAHGVEPQHLSLEGSPLGVSGIRSLKRWKELLSSVFEARRHLNRSHVDACVLFGGYLSLPVLLAARQLHIPTLMHEQNTVAGKVTRLAAKLHVPVACAWQECRGLDSERATFVGMPLRPVKLTDKKEAQLKLLGRELEAGQKLIVILGGSLGSGGMKNVLQKAQNMIESNKYKVLCMGIQEQDKPFPGALTHAACWDMGEVYSAADVVICRAGASTLAELKALGIPAMIVPWLKSADQHQLSNAECFSRLTGDPVFLENASLEEFHEALASVVVHDADYEGLCAGAENLYKTLRGLIV